MSAVPCPRCKRKRGHKCMICNGVRVFDTLEELQPHVVSKHAGGNDAASSGESHFGFLDASTRTRGAVTVAADGDVAGVIVTTTQTVSSATTATKRKSSADEAPTSAEHDHTADTSTKTKRRFSVPRRAPMRPMTRTTCSATEQSWRRVEKSSKWRSPRSATLRAARKSPVCR